MAEEKMLWYARWGCGKPSLCRVKVLVREATYKVVEHEVLLGYWSYGIVYPKNSPHFFDTAQDAARYLRVEGAEVEQNIIGSLRGVQGHNQRISTLIAELEENGPPEKFE